MLTIGVLGGMSWESTLTYYRRINQLVHAGLGGHHSAQMVVASVDFAAIERLQRSEDWPAAADALSAASAPLADCQLRLLATNTMHLVFPQLVDATGGRWLHIADACAAALTAHGYSRPLVLGTRFTMERDFYLTCLRSAGLAPLVPAEHDRNEVDRIIFQELVHGRVLGPSRRQLVDIAATGAAAGADSVLLACTELGLILDEGNVPLPLIDSTEAHCRHAVHLALERES